MNLWINEMYNTQSKQIYVKIETFIYIRAHRYIMIKDKPTFIRVTGEVCEKLKELKVHPRQSYKEVILKLLKKKEESAQE